jgi:hypothetical protein
MWYKDSHLADQELLLAADGELTARRHKQAFRHLQVCWQCRRRMAEIENNIAEFTACYQALLDASAPLEGSSSALSGKGLLSEPGASMPRWRSLAVQLFQWRWAALAASALFVALMAAGYLSMRLATQAGTIPNPRLTPGETITESKSDVCQVPVQASDPEVPIAIRDAVFSEYGMKTVARDQYEIDFLITPTLGGSASLRNLWPEPSYSRIWNAHAKDELEDRLHNLVCSGRLDLSTAQREIATNWVDAYKKYVRADSPM